MNKLMFSFLVVLLLSTSSAFAAETFKKMDTDNDGIKESVVYFDGAKIVRTLVDKNHDGKVDTVVHYRKGHRDRADVDSNQDGKTDIWIRYYFTGIPAEIATDTDKNGKADYWQYFKNGFIYKKEWDRNGDGKPDKRIIAEIRPDFRVLDEDGKKQEVLEELDENYDGSYEVSRKIFIELPMLRVGNAAGATQQVRTEM